MSQSVDLAATRRVGCLYEVMFSETPLVEFRPDELRVKKLSAMMGLHVEPKRAEEPEKLRNKDLRWEGVEDDKDSNGS